ncbi:MAG: type IA DNA topoisomerase [Lachnospiraceae bacterium]|nr:type IA DNA topoisomerase [Lachnospiraceae bacterium]
MGKRLFIAEKPSVAQEFAKALKINASRSDGYIESEDAIVTWCVGHLVTMSYPESYDPSLKKWSLNTLPFIPDEYLYEVIPAVGKQFNIVKGLLNRADVDVIYVCTDSGREGEYIYRLVDQAAKVGQSKEKRRVWIDSQTEEEILRGIKEAKLLSEYDNLSDAAYLRAKEDYLMGINFSRVLTLKYGQTVTNYLKADKWSAISVGRVMTCVLGMVVRREREVRAFVKTPFYRILASLDEGGTQIEAEWKAVEGTKYFETPFLYKENGFKKKEDASGLITDLMSVDEDGNKPKAIVTKVERKKEKKNPPLLFNLAELQNVCAKMFKISPDETLKITQELYEKKLVTYPRTDARVLSTAVAKEIYKNIGGLRNYPRAKEWAEHVLETKSYMNLAKTRYVNDKQITDHYAIIPTGQGFGNLRGLVGTTAKVYDVIVRRFLSIFYPAAEYQKVNIEAIIKQEHFFSSVKVLSESGYLEVADYNFVKKQASGDKLLDDNGNIGALVDRDLSLSDNSEGEDNMKLLQILSNMKKGSQLDVSELNIKEGETSPPKRYSSGTMILAMENAGQLIEDEELRAQIKGSGIGTSATRAEILNKLIKIKYLALNKKTQIITPTKLGEVVFDVVNSSIKSLLNPELTASWEKGLTYVAEGSITKEEYMQKLDSFVSRMTNGVKGLSNQRNLVQIFDMNTASYK